MANINLLPWRDELREEKKKMFLLTLLFVLLCAAGVLLIIDRGYNFLIQNQEDRNAYLQREITRLDAQIAEIQELRRQKDELAARMAVIQDLQGSRPVIVHIMDQTARTIPDRVYYTQIQRSGNSISFQGVAETFPRVTELMTELERSEWFGDEPQLPGTRSIRSGTDGQVQLVSFTVNAVIERPDLTPEDEE